MERLLDALREVLGLGRDPADLTVLQMSLRAVVVFVVAAVLMRLGSKRFMGKSTPLDVLLGIVLGAVVSRAINGGAAFGPTLVASAVLVALHGALTEIATRWPRTGRLLKGRTRVLVRDGRVLPVELQRSNVDLDDLHEALRHHGVLRVDQVKEARLERNGDISVVVHPPGRARQNSHPRVR
jgi:uncharacterized membrane protein YcaP (DUF421 family)